MRVQSLTGRLAAVGSTGRLIGLMVLPIGLLGACEACGPSQAERRAAVQEAQRQAEGASLDGATRARQRATASAVRQALGAVESVVAHFDPNSEIAYLARCRPLVDNGSPSAALECLDEATAAGHLGDRLQLLRARALVSASRFEESRTVLYGIRDRAPETDGLEAQILASYRDDPRFLREVVTLERGEHLTALRALGGGSTVTLKIKLGEDTIAAFKPDQTRRQSNYRAEVAAYRLCPMLRCGFEIPYSFEARIEQRDFLRLYGIRSLEGNTGYAENFVDLIWTNDGGSQYLHGVWKDWVPHFTQFPIEYDDLWDSWVAVDGDPAELDAPLSESLEPLRGRERGNYQEILDEALDADTRELAKQISNLLVFDFLINNWDRFSGAYYGVNCQWADGRFTSIDNGAGFMTREPSRPRTRLHQATRFSRSMIREVRRLDSEALLPILFPDPTDQERTNWEAFLERRQELLDYVDGLIEEHGEDAVLFFE